MLRDRLIAALLASFALAGCSFVPEYKRPAAPVAQSWPASAGETGQGGVAAADLGWREVFTDPRLQALIALALRENRDLRVAALNVELARAQHRITRSASYPTVGGQGSVAITGNEDDAAASYSVGAGVNAFELDLWGRVRSLNQAALEEYLATEEARRSIHISLVAEVATQALTLQALEEQVALATGTLEAVRGAQDITRRRFEAGQRSELDLLTAESQVQTARAEVLRVTRLRAQAENALVLLVGHPLPADLPAPTALDAEPPMAEVPAGLPSELLLRRPDVLAAEHSLKGANANIGAARAAFFPTISLTAFAGLASTALGNLFTGSAFVWSFTPQINQPIFTGGRLQAGLDAAWVRKHIEIAQYEKAIQVAFREVADALAGRATLTDQLEAVSARVAAEQRRYTMSEARYNTGIESYVAVLTAQRDLFAAQQQLIDTRLQRLTNAIELYRALGGGWVEQRTAAAR